MVESHHRLDRHEFEQAPGVGDGQGGLVCCSRWGRNKSDTTERLNNKSIFKIGSDFDSALSVKEEEEFD